MVVKKLKIKNIIKNYQRKLKCIYIGVVSVTFQLRHDMCINLLKNNNGKIINNKNKMFMCHVVI